MFTFAMLASLMVIAVVFVISQYVSGTKISQISQTLSQVQGSLQSLQVLSLLGSSNSTSNCGILSAGLGTLSSQLSQLGAEVQAADIENQSGTQYTNMVNQLTYARIEYWLIAQKTNSQCGGELTTVLMFYKPQNCNNCILEANELSFIQSSNPSLAFVALDGEWNLSVVQALRESYNLSSSDYPAIVVNGVHVSKGYKTSGELLSILCEYTNKTSFCNSTV